MSTRKFLYRAQNLPPKPPKKPKPLPSNLLVVAEGIDPTGRRQVRHMSLGGARARQNARKAGQASQSSGKAHRWTSEEARKIANKLWRTKWRFNKRIGARIGVKIKRRKKVARQPIRLAYADKPTMLGTSGSSLWWNSAEARWFVRDPTYSPRCISEKTALRRLGYISTPHRFVPDTITLVPMSARRRGIKRAQGVPGTSSED